MENTNLEITNEIGYSDNFFTETEQRVIYQYCLKAKYIYGERDEDDYPVTGMTHNIPETEIVYKMIKKKIYDSIQIVRDKTIYRMYVNCFSPAENPYFHTDGEGYTFLYYPSMENYDLNDGGETQFLINGDLHGILPIPNRMVGFNGLIKHRATSFRDRHRFTVAIKYN